MKQRIAIVDFDGTLIEGDLEKKFMSFLLSCREVRYRMLLIASATLPVNFCLNLLGFPSVFKSWTFVIKNKLEYYFELFLDIEDVRLKDKGWSILNTLEVDKIILLTGCEENLLIAYLKKKGLVDRFDRIIATRMCRGNFIVKQHPYGIAKCKYVDDTCYNIGIANEYVDRFYLNKCDEKFFV